MLRKLVFCLLSLCCYYNSNAIDAIVAHTVFYANDPAKINHLVSSIEIYWEINPHTIHFTTNEDKSIQASIKTDIVLLNDKGIVKEDHYILKTAPKFNVDELMTLNVIDLRRYYVGQGAYKIKFMITDMGDTSKHFTYNDTFTIAPPPDTCFYSEIQFLDTIIDDASNSVFQKNGKQHIPVCTNFIDEPRRTMKYYGELYGLNNIDKSNFPLYQTVSIIKGENNVQARLEKTDTITLWQGINPINGEFDITRLGSGNYSIKMRVENSHHQQLASQQLFFQRLNKHPKVDEVKKAAQAYQDTGMESVNVLVLNKTFVAKYTLDEVKAILRMLMPFADNNNRQIIMGFLKSPDDLYMRYFIYNYFSNINKKDPSKAWKEFSEKIIDVNKKYSGNGTPGYETDRGLIYLRYGAPSDVITVENESGSLPYEIWQYANLTQLNRKEITDAIFLFYKPNQMTSDFKLLHSTVLGEAQNISWRSYIYLSSGASSGSNSRAEQYLGNR